MVLVIVAVIVILTSSKKLDESFFVSDGTKYVATLSSGYDIYNVSDIEYTPEKIYLVYFYSNGKVTGVKAYYKYDSESKAKEACDKLDKNIDELDDVDKVEANGEYLIIVSSKSAYEKMTADDAKQQVEFMEMIERMSSGDIDE